LYSVDTIYEAIFIWVIIVRSCGSKVRLGLHEDVDMYKEIEIFFRECFPSSSQ
jgi:hypothetical protein